MKGFGRRSAAQRVRCCGGGPFVWKMYQPLRHLLDHCYDSLIIVHGYFSHLQDLMTVLMGEYKSTADYGHAWDQLGEGGEVLGRVA